MIYSFNSRPFWMILIAIGIQLFLNTNILVDLTTLSNVFQTSSSVILGMIGKCSRWSVDVTVVRSNWRNVENKLAYERTWSRDICEIWVSAVQYEVFSLVLSQWKELALSILWKQGAMQLSRYFFWQRKCFKIREFVTRKSCLFTRNWFN